MGAPHKTVLKLLAGLLLYLASLQSVSAQDSVSVSIELNKVESSANDCVVTFVVTSRSDKSVDKLALEFVVFDAQFRVQRMTVFDFRELEARKFRVRQFRLPEIKCNNLGRLLINDVSACDGTGLDATHCNSGLQISNKTKVEFLN